MRTVIVIAAMCGAGLSGTALAQTARNTPEGIICAVTGNCEPAAASDGRVAVGDEKAFSLARPAAPATNAPTTRTAPPTRTRTRTPAAAPRTRTYAAARRTACVTQHAAVRECRGAGRTAPRCPAGAGG